MFFFQKSTDKDCDHCHTCMVKFPLVSAVTKTSGYCISKKLQ